jgi:hypothetical protein
MTAVRHDIKVEERPAFSAPVVYIAYCSCGKYQSGKHMYRGYAEQAGLDHKKAKEGAK